MKYLWVLAGKRRKKTGARRKREKDQVQAQVQAVLVIKNIMFEL